LKIERISSSSLSARQLSLMIMLAAVTVFAVLDGIHDIYLSWRPQALAPRKGTESALKIAAELDRMPEGATLLVLVSNYDSRELAYAAYHNPQVPGSPGKLLPSTPEKQIPLYYKGRCVMVASYGESIGAQVPGIIAQFNTYRRGNPITRTMAVLWGVQSGVETIAVIDYDDKGNMLK